jgi:hypothetical protein
VFESLIVLLPCTGDWTSQNLTSLEEPPIDGNQTTLEVNRGEFPYDQPGSFTFNMKSDHTKEESVKYIDVRLPPIRCVTVGENSFFFSRK